MKVYTEIETGADLLNFPAWAGGKTWLAEVEKSGKENEVLEYLEEVFPEGATDGEINDALCFDDYLHDMCCAENEEEDE